MLSSVPFDLTGALVLWLKKAIKLLLGLYDTIR